MSAFIIPIEEFSKAAGITAYIAGDHANEEEIIQYFTDLAHWNAQSFCHRYSHHPDCTMDRMDESKRFCKDTFRSYKEKAKQCNMSKTKLMIWLSKFFDSVRYQNCEEDEANTNTCETLVVLMDIMFEGLAPNYYTECQWWGMIDL